MKGDLHFEKLLITITDWISTKHVGMLLPALILLFEKDKQTSHNSQ
jgi:hypothetical protein